MRYSRLLEENNFAGKKADYLCLLVFNASILLVSTAGSTPGVPLLMLRRSARPLGLADHLATPHPAIPVGIASVLARLHLVEEEPDTAIEYPRAGQVSDHPGPFVARVGGRLTSRRS